MVSLAFTDSLGLCGPFTYTLTKSDNSPVDTSIFTLNAAVPSIQIYSTNVIHIGTHNLKLTGTLGTWGVSSVFLVFTVAPSCWDSIITPFPIPD